MSRPKAPASAAGSPGLIIAAPASGSGKTVFTLGLIRHWPSGGTYLVFTQLPMLPQVMAVLRPGRALRFL